MAIKAIICPQCGGQADLDDTREFGFCSHCGTKILITDDVVNNIYNTTQHITKNVFGGKDGKDVEELIVDGNNLIKVKQIERAQAAFQKAIDIAPLNLQAWLGLAFCGAANCEFDIADLETAEKIANESGNATDIALVAKTKADIVEYVLKFDEDDEGFNPGYNIALSLAPNDIRAYIGICKQMPTTENYLDALRVAIDNGSQAEIDQVKNLISEWGDGRFTDVVELFIQNPKNQVRRTLLCFLLDNMGLTKYYTQYDFEGIDNDKVNKKQRRIEELFAGLCYISVGGDRESKSLVCDVILERCLNMGEEALDRFYSENVRKIIAKIYAYSCGLNNKYYDIGNIMKDKISEFIEKNPKIFLDCKNVEKPLIKCRKLCMDNFYAEHEKHYGIRCKDFKIKQKIYNMFERFWKLGYLSL